MFRCIPFSVSENDKAAMFLEGEYSCPMLFIETPSSPSGQSAELSSLHVSVHVLLAITSLSQVMAEVLGAVTTATKFFFEVESRD